jgi:RimJ/RimL family protein N-acetyltransferase
MGTETDRRAEDLATTRLILRPWTAEDITAVLDGPRAADWAEDFPAEGDSFIAGLIAQHPETLGEFGHRLVIERESGQVVGSIGLFNPSDDGTVEFGYGIVVSRRGRGYATEATRALVDFALAADQSFTEVYANVELDNPASVRVLEKAGLDRENGADGTTARFRTQQAQARAQDPS